MGGCVDRVHDQDDDRADQRGNQAALYRDWSRFFRLRVVHRSPHCHDGAARFPRGYHAFSYPLVAFSFSEGSLEEAAAQHTENDDAD